MVIILVCEVMRFILDIRYLFITGMVAMVLFFTGCGKQEEDLRLNEQEVSIEAYVEGLDEESYIEVVVANGVWRIVLDYGANDEEPVETTIGSAIGAETGDSLFFDYAAYVFEGGRGMFFDTSLPDLAESMGLSRDPSEFVPMEIALGRGEVISGLDKGLAGVKEGEHCYVIFSARHGFGNTQTGLVPELSALMYEVWVKKVKKD